MKKPIDVAEEIAGEVLATLGSEPALEAAIDALDPALREKTRERLALVIEGILATSMGALR